MKKQRALSVILLAGLLASCGETAVQSETTADVKDSTPAETAAPFEVRNLGGREFTILAREEEGSYPCEIGAAEENGDVLNDAIYQRDRAVEEALNVKIGIHTASRQNMGSDILPLIMSGDHVFDVGLINYIAMTALLPVEGALLPLDDIGTLDLSADWWDAASIDAFRLTDKAYVASGAVNLNTSTSIYGILFNQALSDEYKLESPYKLVNSGKWTMDKMHEMMQIVQDDTNGDGLMTDDDQYGLISTVNSFQYLFYHTGEELIRKNSDEILEINTTQRLYDAVDKILPVNRMFYKPVDATMATLQKFFVSGHALFYQTSLQSTVEMRAMEADYGILPGPKMDEAQKGYASPLAASYLSLVSIPATNPDTEATGILLNALSYYSDKILMPALYESVLPAKLARDEESTRMIDIMNDTRLYVIHAAFNFGNANNIFTAVQSAGTNTMASQLASYTPAIEASITDLMAKLK